MAIGLLLIGLDRRITHWAGRQNLLLFSSLLSLHLHLHLHLVIWQTLLSKATYNYSSWRGNQTEEVLVTPSFSHCSNKYKLAREGEKDKGNFFFFFFRTSLGWSQVVPKEMSCLVIFSHVILICSSSKYHSKIMCSAVINSFFLKATLGSV